MKFTLYVFITMFSSAHGRHINDSNYTFIANDGAPVTDAFIYTCFMHCTLHNLHNAASGVKVDVSLYLVLVQLSKWYNEIRNAVLTNLLCTVYTYVAVNISPRQPHCRWQFTSQVYKLIYSYYEQLIHYSITIPCILYTCWPYIL